MKVRSKNIVGATLAGVVVAALVLTHSNSGQAKNQIRAGNQGAGLEEAILTPVGDIRAAANNFSSAKPAAIAPFILEDTASSSTDTNLVGNLVIFTAKVGGTGPVALQWQVDKGNGFVDVPAATNTWLGITNAQIADTGRYSLAATNVAGAIRTTPRAITLVDGVD